MPLSLFSFSVESSSEEDIIRKREPLCYKKLKNASTKGDIEKALSMIRGRQEALKHLEVLAYRKLLMHSNSLTNTSHQTSVSFGKDRKSADNFLVSFRNNTQGRVRPVPPPKPVVSSPTVRMNTHLQSAQNLLNELIQISVTGAANTAPAPPQQSDVWTLYLSDFKSSTFLSHNSINKKSKLVKQNNIICFCCLLVNNSGEMNESV